MTTLIVLTKKLNIFSNKKNVKKINLFIDFIENLEKFDILLIKFNINYRNEIIMIYFKINFIIAFKIYKLIISIIMKF